MISEDVLKGYRAKVREIKVEIKQIGPIPQLLNDLHVYETLVRRAKFDLGHPVCRESGCTEDTVFSVGDHNWACPCHGGLPEPGDAHHPVSRQMRRSCEFDKTPMTITERGTRCPTCGHEEFNIVYSATTDEGGEPLSPPDCHCMNCHEKRTASVSS